MTYLPGPPGKGSLPERREGGHHYTAVPLQRHSSKSSISLAGRGPRRYPLGDISKGPSWLQSFHGMERKAGDVVRCSSGSRRVTADFVANGTEARYINEYLRHACAPRSGGRNDVGHPPGHFPPVGRRSQPGKSQPVVVVVGQFSTLTVGARFRKSQLRTSCRLSPASLSLG